MNENAQRILLSPLFLLGLCLLLVNDFYLKAAFHNEVTGKISDIAGLFIFPLFFCALLPRFHRAIFVLTAVLFIVWKLPYSEPFISLWNELNLVTVGRVVDVTDLFALFILPAAYLLFRYNLSHMKFTDYRFAKATVILISVFAFTATHFVNDRSVWVRRSYELGVSRVGFERQLKELDGISVVRITKMTDEYPKEQYPDLDMSPTGYYLTFRVRRPYCESNDLDVFSTFEDKGNFVTIDGPSFRYWCPNEPTSADEDALVQIFDEMVIRHFPGVPHK